MKMVRRRTSRARSFFSLFICIVWFTVAACGTPRVSGTTGPTTEPLLILAASDLQFALPEIAGQFVASGGVLPTITFGSTGSFASQIENGAPADLFFAADRSFIDRLEQQRLIVPGSRAAYGTGRLALVSAPTTGAIAKRLEDLTRPDIRRVALANPEHAPYGRAGQQALQRVGIWSEIEPKLVLGDNVSQTYQFVQTGNAEAGIVALAVALSTPNSTHVLIDEALHQPLVQEAAVLHASKQPDRARAFLDYVNGPYGRAVLERFGFGVPPRP